MADQGWLALLAAALGGGFAVKVVEVVYQEYRSWVGARTIASKSVDASLEPLLRAADELSGKLRSLAEQDFIPIRRCATDSLDDPAFASVVYLFVQFWSEIEIVRFRGLTTTTAQSTRGVRTRAFLACLESRRVRLIDRISQRAIGEAAVANGQTMNFVHFIRSYDEDAYVRRWLAPLLDVLAKVGSSDARQKVLQYATIVHALIDTLDPKHHVTRDRPATPNKLNEKSWSGLNYRVFGVYLDFVADRSKYIGPPKRRP